MIEPVQTLVYEDKWPEGVPKGFRLNLNLHELGGPGTFLPPASSLGDSSVALLPPGSETEPTGWQGQTRPTVEGVADLITGVPMVQYTDLSLPFGGAAFRLNRTRSAYRWFDASTHGTFEGDKASDSQVSDHWWDWAGTGWMIGENPILVLDSRVADIVGANEPTSFLILDAHHSIPFQRIDTSAAAGAGDLPQYEAPPRFRAKMKATDGEWDVRPSGETGWTEYPTQYEVWLYDGALKYTFTAINEDIPPNEWVGLDYWNGMDDSLLEASSFDDRPSLPNELLHTFGNGNLGQPPYPESHYPFDPIMNRGLGTPRYAICTQIEDRYGHIVEINYCDSPRSALDNPETVDCTECQQSCLQRGQISYIKLKVPDSGETSGYRTEWTLVYSHRWFRSIEGNVNLPTELSWVTSTYPESTAANEGIYSLFGHLMLDRIYVFSGDVEDADLEGLCLTVSHKDAPGMTGGIDPLDAYNDVHTSDELPENYRYLVRYHYRFDTEENEPLPPYAPPLLVMSTVEERSSPSVPLTLANQHVFHYRFDPIAIDNAEDPWIGAIWLECVFDQQSIANLAAMLVPPAEDDADGVAQGTETSPYNHPWFTAEALATWRRTVGNVETVFDSIQLDSTQDAPSLAEFVKSYAKTRLIENERGFNDSGEWVGMATDVNPAPEAMFTELGSSDRAYVEVVGGPTRIRSDNAGFGQVAEMSVRTADGDTRHVRIMRMSVFDALDPNVEYSAYEPDPFYLSFVHPNMPTRSVFVHPYHWRTYRNGTTETIEDLQGYINLSHPRWIAIIDEFGTYEAMMSDKIYGDEDGTEEYATKPGQLSRRVVEINPSGVVLGDRTWRFDSDGGATQTGVALGERYFYSTVEEYLTAKSISIPTDAPDSFLKDLLLVEQTSVGWAALDTDSGVPWNRGMVQFYEYDYFAGPTMPSGEVFDWSQRVQLAAEGITRGRGDETHTPVKQYMREWMRDVNAPTTVNFEVQYLTPRSTRMGSEPNWLEPVSGNEDFSNYVVTVHQTGRVSDPSKLWHERAVNSRATIGIPSRQRPGGAWYFPVQMEWYNATGAVDWSSNGLLSNPLDAGSCLGDPLSSLTFTHHVRDQWGKTVFTVLDATEGHVFTPHEDMEWTGSVTVPSFPVGWFRLPESSVDDPALNQVTQFKYLGTDLTDIFLPNGRRWARRTTLFESPENSGQYLAREFIFNDIEEVGTQGFEKTFKTIKPGEVNDFATKQAKGSPIRKRRVEFPGTFIVNWYGVDTDEPEWIEFAQARIAFDSAGRPARAETLEKDANGDWRSLGYRDVNDLGETYRSREIDGTITRQVKDSLGKVQRVYVGTNDNGWADMPTSPDPDFNMALTTRIEYGSGEGDAWQPTVVWKYRNNPIDWFDEFYTQPTSDTDGYPTVTRYDWRMRPVRTDQYGQGAWSSATPLASTLTYLDYLGRPVLQAQFGPGLASDLGNSLDPEEFDVDDPTPEPGDILSVTPRPVSLVQTIYGPDGGVNEVRTFDLSYTGSGSVPYQAAFTYRGRGGATVFQHTGQTASVTHLDSLGRTRASQLIVPDRSSNDTYDYVVAETRFVYDADGNAVETESWERVVFTGTPGSQDSLDETNAIRQRSVAWYDAFKRVVASANLGTEQGDATDMGYVAGPKTSTYDHLETLLTPPELNTTTGALDLTGVLDLPSFARISANAYDNRGNLTHSRSGDGLNTAFTYTGTGRLASKTENCFGDYKAKRHTEYVYKWGRMVGINATRLPDSTPSLAKIEQTRVYYDAEIVNDLFAVVSYNNGLIGRYVLPDATTGETPSGADSDREIFSIRLRYNFAGQVAERIDARNISLRYTYDELDRLSSIQVGHYTDSELTTYAPEYPDITPLVSGTDADAAFMVGHVEYRYDDNNRLSDVIARTLPPSESGTIVISHNKCEYDDQGRLITDGQVQFPDPLYDLDASPFVGPKTTYDWHSENYASASEPGYARLTSMSYPTLSTHTRTLDLEYGSSGSDDDLLSRVSAITTSVGGPAVDVASFNYVGTGRRAYTARGDGFLALDLRGTDPDHPGLAKLDQFGRARDVHYKSGGSDTLWRSTYGYDHAGNQTWSRITQVDGLGAAIDNEQSAHNTYDALNRLVASTFGELDLTGSEPEITAATEMHEDAWQLDLLGNWVGGANTVGEVPSGPGTISGTTVGRYMKGNLDRYGTPWAVGGASSTPNVRGLQSAVDQRNRYTALDWTTGSVSSPVNAVYDAAGNLVWDGRYYYQFDAWNRLVQINRATRYVLNEPPPEEAEETPETPVEGGTGVPGGGGSGGSGSGGGGSGGGGGGGSGGGSSTPPPIYVNDLVKHYVYDGFGRMIQARSQVFDSNGDAETDTFTVESFYYDGSRRIQERFALQEDEMPHELEGDFGLEREYVWGLGEGISGSTELLAEFDHENKPWWPLQSLSGDVVSLLESGFDTNEPSDVRVVGNWNYNAYGEVIWAAHYQDFPDRHIGHKGLPVDRMDSKVERLMGGQLHEPPRLIPYAHNVAHAGNRAYLPQYGRWLQPDPNATGQTLMSGAMYGSEIGAVVAAFDFDELFGDGANLYEYLGSNPWNRFDPMGLAWDPFSAVDDYVAEMLGSIAAFMERLIGGAKTAAYVGMVVMSMLPFPVTAIAADIGASILEGDMPQELVMARKVLGVAALSSLAVTVAKIGYTAIKTAAQYVMKYGSGVFKHAWNGMRSLAGRAKTLLTTRKQGSCGCFTAGTLVWTSVGLTPIELIQVGDLVLSRDELSGQISYQPVAETMVTYGASLLELQTVDFQGNVETIQTTDEHPFWVECRGWVRADALRVGDEVLTLEGLSKAVIGSRFTSEQTSVYNLFVERSHSYLVGMGALVVHNCGSAQRDAIVNHVMRDGGPARMRELGVTSKEALEKLISRVTENGTPYVRSNGSRAWALNDIVVISQGQAGTVLRNKNPGRYLENDGFAVDLFGGK